MSLILYQIMLFDPELSTIRLLNLVGLLIGLIVISFFVADVSEMLDDCFQLMRRALTNCSWTLCSPAGQRDICFLLRRVQCSQHLKFNGGFIVVTRMFFMNMIKSAYSFVNFMKITYK
ncbi:hypothetical protein WDU94_007923 [Cyamophila willieti]